MRKSMFVLSIACAGIIAASSGIEAQTQGSQKMMQDSKQQQVYQQKQDYHSNMHQGMMGDQRMGPGMMGGMGMGPGMMDGMGPGMSDSWGMGMNMMGGMGPMMHYRMMGGSGKSIMNNFDSFEDFEKFLDETKEQRQKLHTMKFDYMEKMRQPETTVGELKQMRQEIFDLVEEIHEKAQKSNQQ